MKKNHLATWLNALLPPIMWAGVIYLFSSQATLPGFEVSSLDFLLKKSGHMFVYAVLYLLVYRGVSLVTNPKTTHTHWWLPIIICLVYAATDEFHQSFVPGRYPTVRDIGYDALGTWVAFLWKNGYI